MFTAKIIDLGREREVVGFYQDALFAEKEDRLGKSKDAFKTERTREQKDSDNHDRAVRRAKTKIRRLAKRYNMQYMWTLTFRSQTVIEVNPRTKKQTVYDASNWESAWKVFERFIARCRKAGLKFNYICTAEIQEKRQEKYGETVYHFHMATDLYIPQNKMMLKKYNYSHKKPLQYALNDFWTFGNTKVTKKQSNRFCSNYMIKYISKVFDDIDIKAKQRYRISQGMEIPVVKMEFQSDKELLQWIIRENIPKLDKKGNLISKYMILGDRLEVWWYLLEG